ncbi:unnamed protein product [Natator depressus]
MNFWDKGVLVEQTSPNNAALWPVLKGDSRTWRLVVDFCPLNWVNLLMAPIVEKYQEVMVSIVGGAQCFSVLDVANAFFAIPLHQESYYKFAFTFQGKQLCFARVPKSWNDAPINCHAQVVKM